MTPVVETPEVKPGGPNGGGHDGHGPFDRGPYGHGGGGGDEHSDDHRGVSGAGLLAMRFLLVSISMLFVTIGFAYHERAKSAAHWQHIHIPQLLWLSSGLILASTWTLEIARSAFARRNSVRYAGWLAVTVGLGAAFLASQVFALRELASQGIYLRHNPHSSLFYVLTGAHGIHLLGGMVALVCLLITAARRPEVVLFDFRKQTSRNAAAALYWHFLAGVWLCLFVALLFWP
ncbi:MAG TPA: cytochrome c oxidase subunit 3 [Bryobacteraceae bacterium]|nr:cytochrome c oxidase subunit 3 [Bryobacteraceae bacterium]